LREYLLVAQDQMLVEHFVRAEDVWLFSAASDPDSAVRLPAIGCDLPLAEVYRRVVFPSDAEATD